MESKQAHLSDTIAMCLSSATGAAVLGSAFGITGSLIGCILGAIVGAIGAHTRHQKLATRRH